MGFVTAFYFIVRQNSTRAKSLIQLSYFSTESVTDVIPENRILAVEDVGPAFEVVCVLVGIAENEGTLVIAILLL